MGVSSTDQDFEVWQLTFPQKEVLFLRHKQQKGFVNRDTRI